MSDSHQFRDGDVHLASLYLQVFLYFNADSVIRIRVEKGIFKQGDNALIDSVVFKKDTTVTKVKDYPIDAVYGKVLKKGPEDYTDVRGQVVADYQEQLEKEWVAELRRKYTFEVYPEVLKTVNGGASLREASEK